MNLAADRFGTRLVPLGEAAAVHGFVETVRKKKPEFLYKIRIPNAYVGTSKDRRIVERILNEDPGGDLSKFLLQNKELFPAIGGNMAHWKAHPEMIELVHVLSKREGGREVFILMTKARNQTFSANMERSGGVFLDEAIVIQGIAVDRMSALEWVKKGWFAIRG